MTGKRLRLIRHRLGLTGQFYVTAATLLVIVAVLACGALAFAAWTTATTQDIVTDTVTAMRQSRALRELVAADRRLVETAAFDPAHLPQRRRDREANAQELLHRLIPPLGVNLSVTGSLRAEGDANPNVLTQSVTAELPALLATGDRVIARTAAAMPAANDGGVAASQAYATAADSLDTAITRWINARMDLAVAGATHVRRGSIAAGMGLAAAAAAAGLLGLLRTLVTRNMLVRLEQVTLAIRNLAQHDAAVAIPSLHDPDTVGDVARAVAVFRADAAELRETNRQFDAALNNMAQGLLMFDSEFRLVVCNRRLLELYGLQAQAMQPGISLRDMVAHSLAMGNHPGQTVDGLAAGMRRRAMSGDRSEFLTVLPDGRCIAARWQAMPGGGWIAIYEDITERQQALARIAHMAEHDALTDLPNSRAFRAVLEHALARARRGESFAVLCVSLDRFKQVNETLGHPVGDALLRQVGLRLRHTLREQDTVARLGGDEFAVLQADLEQPQQGHALAQRLVETLSKPYDVDGHAVVVGASIGIVLGGPNDHDGDLLLRNAGLALLRAKQDGRGTFRFFEPDMDARAQSRRVLELDLREALTSQQFELYYQPLINLHDGRIMGFEALLRWRHPTRGMVPPDAFIPLAEEIGLIVPIGAWVLRTACAEAMLWQAAADTPPIRVAVNLSSLQFTRSNLEETVRDALAESGLPGDRLELEITESVLLQDNADTLSSLHRLRDLGARISMDDFGTGYSSLNYLRSFPFDKLKIDKSFIKGLGDSQESSAIVRAIAGLGAALGIATTAEGVETLAQLEQVIADGCTEVQGYYFSRPRPAGEIPGLLATPPERVAA